ncbi:hypothetical protein E2C01_099363 [Portunus trituberculatus]|uniref:Uncharacterized protein n=1 Tax=Portunus trituberculatus TaxID=210409 RepID=A0A5B7KAL5_PORTR|nr:hypothetical protein [Portunus trituberculatus]
MDSWRGSICPPRHRRPETAGEAAGDREMTMACVFSGTKPTCHVSSNSVTVLNCLLISLTAR